MIAKTSFLVLSGAQNVGALMARPKGKKPAVRLSVSLDTADHAELSRLAAQHDLTVAWMVRKAVSEFVARNASQDQPVLPLHRGGGGANA